MNRYLITLSPEALVLLSALFPALVALVTSKVASGAVKSVTLLLLAAIPAAYDQVVDVAGAFDLRQFIFTTIAVFMLSVGVHFGLLKPVGLTGSEGAIQQALPRGIGTPTRPPAKG